MTNLSQIAVVWSGTAVVGGGFSILHCSPGDEHALMTDFRAMLNTCVGNFPNTLTVSFPSSGSTILESDGSLVGGWADPTPPALITGASANTWANGVGIRVRWTTGQVHNSHRIVGSTFFVPLQINAYEGAGNIQAVNLGQFQTAGNTLAAAGHLRVYSRDTGIHDGVSFPVIGCDVPDKVSWLRGRRT